MPNTDTPVEALPCSRTMGSGIFGPLDDSIDFRVNGDSKIEWMKAARERGYNSLGEYIRMTMEKDVHGEAHVVSMFTKHLMGNGKSVGQVQGGSQS